VLEPADAALPEIEHELGGADHDQRQHHKQSHPRSAGPAALLHALEPEHARVERHESHDGEQFVAFANAVGEMEEHQPVQRDQDAAHEACA
jgi:hypothetical protein